jgi:AraC-like DNA-binding protein
VGVPPHAYQIQLRIARARHLLALGMPPSAVAAEVGFHDQSHFIRHFKRVLHVTPGEFAAVCLPGRGRHR